MAAPQLRVVGSTIVAGNGAPTVQARDAFDLVMVTEGTWRWIQWCAESSAYTVKDVADLIEWHLQVQNMPFETREHQARFMKRFMSVHAGKSGWRQLLRDDREIREYITRLRLTSRGPNAGAAGGRGGQGGGGQQSPNKRQRSDPKGKAASDKWFCLSRHCRTKGPCDWNGPCKRSHKCACCGQDHAAKLCPTWDKAKKNLA